MKYVGLLLAMSMISPLALGADYITGSCTFTLSGNDTTSNYFSGAERDEKLESLEESVVEVSDFRVDALSRFPIKQKFENIIPYYDDVNKYQHYQIAVFNNDYDSKVDAGKTGAKYLRRDIKGAVSVAVGYGGKNTSAANEVTIDIMGLKKKPKTIVAKFDKKGKASAEFEYIVPIQYKDYGRDGFLGFVGSIFKGDVTVKEARKAGLKIHESEVEAECDFQKLMPQQKEEERKISAKSAEEEEEDDEPEVEYFGSEFTSADGAVVN